MDNVVTATRLVGEQTTESPCGLLDTNNALLLGAALLIWCFELRLRNHRSNGSTPMARSNGGAQGLLRCYAPEAIGFALTAALAIHQLSQGDAKDQIAPDDQAAWEQIKKQWPLLTCADSLLVLQAMGRLLLLLSNVLRSQGSAGTVAEASPLAGEPAFLLLLAAACRVWLAFCSPDHQLEGPLHGPVHLAFEVAALPLLLLLCPGTSSQRPTLAGFAAATAAAVGATWFSTFHRLPLADNMLRDSAFTLVQLMELVACGAYLVKTVCIGGLRPSPCAYLTYTVLPIQQACSLYFFLLAFEPSLEQVCVGRPLLVLQISGAAQLVMLLFAAVVFYALKLEEHEFVKPAVQPTIAAARLSDAVF